MQSIRQKVIFKENAWPYLGSRDAAGAQAGLGSN